MGNRVRSEGQGGEASTSIRRAPFSFLPRISQIVEPRQALLDAGLASPVTLQSYRYWLANQHHLDDTAVNAVLQVGDVAPGLTGNIIVMEVIHDPLDFRYIYIGRDVLPFLNRDWTGSLMSELPFQRMPSSVWYLQEATAMRRRLVVAQAPYVGPISGIDRAEVLMVPIPNAGRTNQLIISLDFLGPMPVSRYAC